MIPVLTFNSTSTMWYRTSLVSNETVDIAHVETLCDGYFTSLATLHKQFISPFNVYLFIIFTINKITNHKILFLRMKK